MTIDNKREAIEIQTRDYWAAILHASDSAYHSTRILSISISPAVHVYAQMIQKLRLKAELLGLDESSVNAIANLIASMCQVKYQVSYEELKTRSLESNPTIVFEA